MSLYKPDQPIQAPPEESVAIIHQFLNRCLHWAEQIELPKIHAELNISNDPGNVARLRRWTTYREFTLHTIKELEDGTLDHWFQTDPKPDE